MSNTSFTTCNERMLQDMADEIGVTQQRQNALKDPKYAQCNKTDPVPAEIWASIDILNGSYTAGAFSKAIDESYNIYYRRKANDASDRLVTSILNIVNFLQKFQDNFIEFNEFMTKSGKYAIFTVFSIL